MRFILSILFLSVCYSTVINVPVDQNTIQLGLTNASEGDTVFVSEGIYYENIYINQKSITILSENGNENTPKTSQTIAAMNHLTEFLNNNDEQQTNSEKKQCTKEHV